MPSSSSDVLTVVLGGSTTGAEPRVMLDARWSPGEAAHTVERIRKQLGHPGLRLVGADEAQRAAFAGLLDAAADQPVEAG